MVSLIVGLGNIGIDYAGTRHNLGFDLLDRLSSKWKILKKTSPGDFHMAAVEFKDRSVTLIWPTTYMNDSGAAVARSIAAYWLTPADILVVHDDFNLPLGKLRIRTTGSDGGHNGMESVIGHLGTEDILRLRMGIGPLPEGMEPMEFVLGRFSADEVEIKNKMLVKAGDAVLYLLKNRPEEAMSVYNRDPAPDGE